VSYRNRLDTLLLASAVATTRFAFRSRDLYDLDSVNFALAMKRFDPRVHQPHPPGYFLYILMGRFIDFMVHDANLALVLLSIAASTGMVIMIYRMAWGWFGPGTARFAGILFLFSPLGWFHGTVALTYSLEAFFSALLGDLCWRIECGKTAFIAPASLILGISAGVRPSSLLLLGPLFLFSLRKATASQKVLGGVVLVLTLATWFLPMIWASDGLGAYFGALVSLWQLVPARDTVFNSSPATSIARACTIVFIYFLCFGLASVVPLAALRRTTLVDPKKKIFTIVWISPALCFFTFVYLRFVNSGYLLLLLAPACIWLGSWASEWYEHTGWRKSWKVTVIGLCGATNVLIFLVAPLYCSYKSVRQFETELASIRSSFPQFGPPDATLIVGFDSHFLGYRHGGYYLPNYLTIEYPEVKLREGTRIFAMHERDSSLLTGLPAAAYTRFVLFPLQGGDVAYQQYMQKVEKLLPQENLRILRVGDHEFVSCPISDLPLLFPDAASAPRQSVYAALHSGMPPVNNREHQAGQEER